MDKNSLNKRFYDCPTFLLHYFGRFEIEVCSWMYVLPFARIILLMILRTNLNKGFPEGWLKCKKIPSEPQEKDPYHHHIWGFTWIWISTYPPSLNFFVQTIFWKKYTGCPEKNAPPFLLNLSSYEHARKLGHNSLERWDP